MWTCPKCGEKLEDQFDSCWKCANNLEDIKRELPPTQHLSWVHYLGAALVSYLTTWLAVYLWMFIHYFILSHPFDRFHPERDSLDFPLSVLLWMTIPAAVNFLILLPFLRFPVRRRTAYGCLLAAWTFIFWFFQAETR